MSTPRDTDADWPHFVYRIYDAADNLLYIGCTDDVDGRIYHLTHFCNRSKYPNAYLYRQMARHTVEEHPTRLTARAAERAAIAAERPLLNKQHNPSRFRKGADGRPQPVAPVHPVTAAAIELVAS